MFFQKILKSLKTLLSTSNTSKTTQYTPTFFLKHHFLQSAYELTSPDIDVKFERQKVYFTDGGHMSLDWANKSMAEQGRPIIMIMHGMTGGSETKYIKALVEKANQYDFCSVCLNSRGINSQMTSPIPFVGVEFHQLNSAFERIKAYYPSNPLYMIGTSLGANYVLRYLLQHKVNNLRGLVLISPPFDVKYVINGMNMYYQRFFIKSYLKNTILKHEQMKFWWESGIVDIEHLKKSKNMRQFHDRITIQILGFENSDDLFDHFKIKNEAIQKYQTRTLILAARDDPMVGFQSLPVQSIKKNKNIQLITTQSGGHICWFEGFNPKRWYPKPVFEFITKLENQNKEQLLN